MSDKGTAKLEVKLDYTENLSKKTPATVQSLLSIYKAATKTTSAIDKMNKALGGALVGKRAGGGSRLPAELQRGVSLTRQIAAEAGRGLRLETQQARLLREQTRARTEGVRLAREEARLSEQIARAARPAPRPAALPRRAGYQTGAWMRDSDRPPDWRRELGDTRPPRRRGHGPDAPDGPDAPGRVERFGRHAGRARDAAYDFGDAYGQARASIQTYTDPASELTRARMRLGTLGLDPREAARADEAIRKTVAAVPGARLSEVTQAFAELYEVFASVEDTARTLPRAAQYSFAMKTVHGDRYSPEQLITQTKAAYKFVDLIGLTKPDAAGRVDHARVDSYHDTLMQVLSATGGEVNPREMLQAAKIGGTSLMGMSREGLAHIASLASDVTGSRAGNMQRSLLQSFVGGKLFDSNIDALAQYGMVDRSKIRKQRNGKLDIQPGGIRGAETISTDPLIFIDMLAEGMRRKGVDTNVEKDVINATAKLTPNSLAQNMIAQSIIRREEMTRFDELLTKAEKLGPMLGRAEASPLGKIEDAQAKQENLRATVGLPMLDAGGGASSYLAPFYADLQKFAEGRPVMAAALAGIAGLGRASLSAGEGIGTLAGLLRELRGGGGGGAGILGTGLDGSDLATGGYIGLRALQSLRGVLAALKSPVAVSIGLTAASVFTIKQISDLYDLMEEKKKADAAASAANTGNLGAIDRARGEFAAEGKPVPRELWKVQAGGALAKLNPDNQLRDALGGWTAGALVKDFFQGGLMGADVNPYKNVRRFEPESAARVFKERAPELGQPEIMAEFRRMVDGLRLPSEQRATLDKGLAHVFPESFQKSSQLLAEALGKLPDPATQATKALSEILNPARNLPPSLASLVYSFDSAAAQIRSLEIRPPSVYFPPAPGATGGGASGAGKPKTGNRFIDNYDALGGFRERGGPVRRGVPYVVGEAGAELFTPGADGFITPHHMLGEGAGAVDYSAFQAGSVGGGGHTFNVQISVPAGSAAAEDSAALAQMLRAELARLAAQLEETRADLYDPRFHGNMTARELNWQRERA